MKERAGHVLAPFLLGHGFAIASFLSTGQLQLDTSDAAPSSCLSRAKTCDHLFLLLAWVPQHPSLGPVVLSSPLAIALH